MSRKELSPSEYEEVISTGRSKSATNPNYIKYGIISVVVIVLCGVSFGAGMSYQKGKQTTPTTANTNEQFPSQGSGPGGFGGQGGFRNGQRPNIGEVTAVSSDSITIQDSRSNSNKTFKITSETTVQDNGSAASASDIKSGDTVLVIADSSDASTASQIMLNPSFNGPQSGGN